MNFYFASRISKALARTLVLGALASASAAFAQSHTVTATVPFPFEVNGQKLPAGPYRLDQMSAHILNVRSTTNHAAVTVITNEEQRFEPTSRGKLVFRKYGHRYFLSQVWAPGSSIGQSCVKSRAEKEVQLAKIETAAPDVTLALISLPR